MAYQVQVRGEFAGSVGGWRAAIRGTLNQTGHSDEVASVATSNDGAQELVELVVGEGAREEDVRVVRGTLAGVKADGFTVATGEVPRFVVG